MELKNNKMKMKDCRIISLDNGDYIQIKFEKEGIVYDRFNKDDEHIEAYGYDFCSEIRELVENQLNQEQNETE